MKKNFVLLAVAGLVLALAPTAQADLVITVDASSGTQIDFSWNGTIGDSGVAGTLPSGTQAPDQIVPSEGQVQLGDRDIADSGSKWTAASVYAGSSFAFGSGGGTAPGDGFSDFLTEQNIGIRVITTGHATLPGDLLVGFTDQLNTTGIPLLASTVFTGSFSLPGTFATYGIFDTAGTNFDDNATVTLWSAASGTGSISFAAASAIPEPGTISLLAIAGLGLMFNRRRRA